MGITIHYTLITRDYKTVVLSILTAKKLAEESGYAVREISEKAYVSYSPFTLPLKLRSPEYAKEYLREVWRGYREEVLIDVPDEPPWPWIAIDYPEPGYFTYATPWILSRSGKPTIYEGVEVSIPTAEPFTMAFYRIGEYYICDNFTKTQAFTVDEVKPNTQFHKWICRLLKFLEREGDWWSFFVGDEAEYYDTLDESKIVDSYESVARIIYTIAVSLDKHAEKIGGSVEVGGRIDVRRLRKKHEEASEDRRAYQSSLDEFINRRLDRDG